MKPRKHLPASTLAFVLLIPTLVSAQAWTPPKGEGFLTFTIQSLDAGKHLFSSPVLGGNSLDVGAMEARALVLDGDFGITDKLAVTTSLAYVNTRYTEGGRIDETNPESPHRHLDGDDGDFHGSFQDARVALRYMQPKGLWVFTPTAAIVVPLRDYQTIGHAAFGRGLNELQLEFDVGRLLFFSGRPRAYAQGRYRYTFVEKVGDISPNRSNLLLELGYLAHPRLTLRAFGDWQDSHGGFELPLDVAPDNFHIHDRLAAARWLRAGVGLSIPVGKGVDFFASLGRLIEGENTHDGTTISVGTTWGFQAPGFGRTKIRFPEPGD